jgi:uncharacterized protein YndB with AHSA1/START domain
MQKEIKQSWYLKQSPQEVWDYLTIPELLEQWLMETDFRPILTQKFRFICNSIIYCEVLGIVPNKLLSYSWKEKSTTGETIIDSRVSWTLFEKDGGTELRLVHGGFTTTEDFTGHNNAWTALRPRLIDLLNTVKK